MNILILSKYAPRGPSSRYRFLQYLPALAEAGHRFTVLPLFDDRYLERFFSGKKPGILYLTRRFLARLGHLATARRYDLAWIEGELVPFLPAGFEKLLAAGLPARRVYDFDDAVWLRYAGRPILADKFRKTLVGASGIVAGNTFLEGYLHAINEKTLIVPTVIDWDRYKNARPALAGATIGWIGSPATRHFLDEAAPALQTLAKRFPLELCVVGSDYRLDGVAVTSRPWSAGDEVAAIASFDVGIMPLTATPFAEGKCGLKLVQYLATGLPVVASPVGVNSQIISRSAGGFLAADAGEWVEHLGRLLVDPSLRRTLGDSGRAWVQSEMTVTAQAPRLIAFLESRLQ